LLDSRAVREQAHIVQSNAFARFDAAHHGVRVFGLHANDFDAWSQALDISGYATDEAASANGHKHRVNVIGLLAQNLHGNRALAGDDIGVVKRMHEGQLLVASSSAAFSKASL